MSTTKNDMAGLEDMIGYRFRDRRLLLEALTHRSFINECGDETDKDNQRLEFFGDAVLGLFVSSILLEHFPASGEGKLSKSRAALVNEKILARIADGISLGSFLRLGRGEERTGGRQKPSLLADAYEALVAAVYLDGGAAAAEAMVTKCFRPLLAETAEEAGGADYKTELQELVQQLHGEPPRYVVRDQAGPPHDRVFTVRVVVGNNCIGEGSGKTKKDAAQSAARQALAALSGTAGKKSR